jgi:hypothetical protein
VTRVGVTHVTPIRAAAGLARLTLASSGLTTKYADDQRSAIIEAIIDRGLTAPETVEGRRAR